MNPESFPTWLAYLIVLVGFILLPMLADSI